MSKGIVELKNRLMAPYNGLRVTWFDSWHPSLDVALQSLPEMETCPHELFRMLAGQHGAEQKRLALVTEKGEPVAVVGLRRISKRYRYELVTWVIVPDSVFPAKPGYHLPALEALGVEVIVGWRRMASAPPPSLLMRDHERMPVHQMTCLDNFEEYWRTAESGHWNTIKRSRKRCKDFTFAVNAPGAADWTIRNWGKVWNIDPVLVEDSLMIAKYFEECGKFFTLLLLDQEKPLAGHTFIPHGNCLVWEHTYRDPEYDSLGVGTRLMDLAFSWAVESGFDAIDLGGQHSYKSRWAPENGEVSIFTICPEPLFQMKQLQSWMRRIRSKLRK
jgi:hypothetical protein